MPNSQEDEALYGKSGWRSQPALRSLSEVHRSIAVPHRASFYRKILAFAGPGFLVAVGDDKADVTKDFIVYYNAKP